MILLLLDWSSSDKVDLELRNKSRMKQQTDNKKYDIQIEGDLVNTHIHTHKSRTNVRTYKY